jgi:hypothetical protein
MGGNVALSKYMMLPVEQYFVLDPNQIKWIEGNRFHLTVPRLQFFDIWLEPDVEISVTMGGSPPKVILQVRSNANWLHVHDSSPSPPPPCMHARARATTSLSVPLLPSVTCHSCLLAFGGQAENCRIRGSELIENMRLDQKFCLRFVTELTWTTKPFDGETRQSGAVQDRMCAHTDIFSADRPCPLTLSLSHTHTLTPSFCFGFVSPLCSVQQRQQRWHRLGR